MLHTEKIRAVACAGEVGDKARAGGMELVSKDAAPGALAQGGLGGPANVAVEEDVGVRPV
jgi:hypothetical protein